MAANTSPIFTGTPKNGFNVWTSSTTANTKNDGAGTIGTDMLLLYTAGTNGAFIQKVRITISASTASTTTTNTVARVYRSTQTSGATTNANTFRLDEITLPSISADVATSSTNPYEIPLGVALAAGETILVSCHHAAAANSVWQFTAYASDY